MLMLVQLQSSHFLHKIHSNSLPLGDVVLSGTEKLETKKIFVIKVSLQWNYYKNFNEILHYKLFPLS